MTYKKPEKIETNELCKYGCGLIAKYKSSSGNLICKSSHNKCTENRKKNSEQGNIAAKKKDYLNRYSNMSQESRDNMNWNKGLTKETNDSVKKQSKTFSDKIKCGEIISYWKGRKLSDAHKKKISDKRIENGSSRRKIYIGKPVLFYYIKVNDLYKVGLTIYNVQKRFRYDINKGVKIEIIEEILFQNGEEAFDLEQKILKENKDKRYKGPKILKSGNTELLTEGIESSNLSAGTK